MIRPTVAAASGWSGRLLAGLLLLVAALWPAGAGAHDLGIARAELLESAAGRYTLVAEVPFAQAALFAAPILPPRCAPDGNPLGERGRTEVRFSFTCSGPLTADDAMVLPWAREGVLLTAAWAGGDRASGFFKSRGDSIEVGLEGLRAGSGSWPAAARRFTALGIEHILLGVDHLLFVFGLLLLVRGSGALIAAITAFTLAHSLTLALATLEVVVLPPAPVEAVIALSIVFLAKEIVAGERGVLTLAHRRPWVVAFGFGLLHGLGFAGALGEVGLPRAEIPIALLFFNIGVELGQCAFVAAVLLLRRAVPGRSGWATVPFAYAIGTTAMHWLIERMVGVLGLTPV